MTASVSIAGGILAGLTFEKLMYLCLQKLLRFETGMKSEFHMETVFSTAVLFFGIFALTLCYNLLQIRLSNPSELLRAGKEGEKEPRTKWVLALVGIVFLGIGYCIALTTESPLEAIPKFFLAVICVIIGTYALFIAGSITFLKFLKGRKRFYYQTKHFVSVSGMIYRMKQNGAGLANICILSTIVLVMISATASLYLGIDDVISSRYPRESRIKTSFSTPEQDRQMRQIAEEVYGKYDVKMVETMEYHYGSFVSVFDGERFLKENEVSQEDMLEVCFWRAKISCHTAVKRTKNCGKFYAKYGRELLCDFAGYGINQWHFEGDVSGQWNERGVYPGGFCYFLYTTVEFRGD